MYKSPAQAQADPTRNAYSVSGPLPVARGSHRLPLKLLAHPWNYTVNDEGDTRGDSYWYSIAAAIQWGPVAKVRDIIAQGKRLGWGFALTGDHTGIIFPWGDYGIRLRFYKGTDTQTVDPLLGGFGSYDILGEDGSYFHCNNEANIHPPYGGKAYVVFDTLATHLGGTGAGMASPSLPQIEFDTYTLNEVINPGGESERHGVNPLGFFFDLFRSARYGLELPDSRVPLAEWSAAAAAYLAERGAGEYISPILSGRSDVESVLQDLMPYVRAYLPRSAKKILPRWMSYASVSLPSLPLIDGRADVIGEPEIKENDPAEVYRSLTVKCTDFDEDLGEASVTIRSPFQRRLTNEANAVSQDLPHIHDVTQARNWGEREIINRTYPPWEAPVRVPRAVARNLDGSPIRAGDLVRFFDEQADTELVCRVIKRKERRGQGVTLTLREEPGQSGALQTSEPDEREEEAAHLPGDVEHARAWLLPDALRPGSQPELAVLLNQPAYATSAEVWISSNGDFAGEEQQLAALTNWAAHGTLLADLTDAATEATFAPGAADPLLVRSFTAAEQADGYMLLLVEDEVIILGAFLDADTGSVTYGCIRGAFGTAAVAHATETPVWIVPRSRLSHYTHVLLGSAAFLRLIPSNTAGLGNPSPVLTVA